jgi:hypothetical protein
MVSAGSSSCTQRSTSACSIWGDLLEEPIG